MCITSSYSELPSRIQQGRRVRREKSKLISLLLGKIRINKKSEEIEKELESSLSAGLTNIDAKSRLEKYGPNALQETEGKSLLKKLKSDLL